MLIIMFKMFPISMDFSLYLILTKKIQQAISLEPHSPKSPLKTIDPDDRVVILGKGELIFPY